jgi:hypothetical protein
VALGNFENMFDSRWSGIDDLSALSDAQVVDAIGELTRAENAMCARKLAAMAELFGRRTGCADAAARDMWWVDPDAAVAAEIGAAGGISQGLAMSQTHRGVALRDRLPKIAALFAAGLISDLLVRTIVWRTALIESPTAMAALDRRLAERVIRWGALSEKKTEAAIDDLVDQIDPGGLRHSRSSGSRRDVQFGSPGDEPGFMTMWARVYATDGVVIEQRVEEMARSVCEADPRSADERRADALAPATTNTDFACQCGQPHCAAATSDRPAKNAVVYVVADESSVDAASTPPAAPASTPAESAFVESAPGEPVPGEPAPPPARPAFVLGAGVLPNALLGGILERATIREVRHPGVSPPAPRYAPPPSMADFVRCRDLTCRFPGCEKPAQFCDLDHTVAYPVGPTHPSNLKCLCRFHHMLKTFWDGATGWRDRQLPDGTVVQLCEPTATLWPGESPVIASIGERGATMPKRRHTRAHDTAKAIATERNKPPPF